MSFSSNSSYLPNTISLSALHEVLKARRVGAIISLFRILQEMVPNVSPEAEYPDRISGVDNRSFRQTPV